MILLYKTRKYFVWGLFIILMINACKDEPGDVYGPYPDDLPSVKDTVSPNVLGCFLAGVEAKNATIPSLYENKQEIQNSNTVRIVIDPSKVFAQVSKYIYGNNVNQYNGNLSNQTKLITYLNLLKPHILRYPGGLHSNEFFWNADGKANLPTDLPSQLLNSSKQPFTPYWVAGKNGDSWNFSLDNFYDFLKKTNCEALMTVNYSYARYGTGPTPVQTAAHLAAEWVRYDFQKTQELGIPPTKFWEIGNENCANWASGYYINTTLNQDGQPETITPALYGQHVAVFADSMRKAAAEFGHTIYIGSQNDVGVFAGAGDSPDWMVDHTYFTPFQQNSNAKLILSSVLSEAPIYPKKTRTETTKYSIPLKPITLTEWNIFAEGSGQNTSYINGMHAAIVFGELIKNQYGMSNRWDIINGWSSVHGEDMGMFSLGQDDDATMWNPYPPFYYMYYFQQFFGDKMVNYAIDGAKTDILVYASSFTSGELGVVIINKGTTAQVAQLYFMNFTPGQRYYYFTLTGGNERATENSVAKEFSRQVFVNGNGPTTKIGGPIDKISTIKPFSSPMTNTFKIELPARSVEYILIEDK